MEEINGIKIINSKEILKPVFDYFKLEYGDNSVITKLVHLLNDISNNDLFEQAVDLIQYGKPFDFFATQNLYTFIQDITSIEQIIQDQLIDSELTIYNNSLANFSNYILSKTRDYDEIIKYFLTYSDLLYYLKLSSSGKKILIDIYFKRGIDFFLTYNISGNQYKASEYPHYFHYSEYISEALLQCKRFEESEYVRNEIEKRKLGLKEISDSFSPDNPDKSFEALRLHSERFWFDYLGEDVFSKLKNESKNELIDSIVTEVLIEKRVLTNFSQVALAFCKVIERELNESLFQPYIEEYRNCTFRITEPNISKNQRNKIEVRLNTINVIKKCVKSGQQLTFGQIVFLLRFWNDPLINDYSDLFLLIKQRISNFADITQAIDNLIGYFELNDIGLTLTDIRNSSAHPTTDKDINWSECVKWIKQMLGEPPKEILKRIVINLR
jgi:hypothetical protein